MLGGRQQLNSTSLEGESFLKEEIIIKMEIPLLSNRSGRGKKKKGVFPKSLAAGLSCASLASSGKQKLCLVITKLHLQTSTPLPTQSLNTYLVKECKACDEKG